MRARRRISVLRQTQRDSHRSCPRSLVKTAPECLPGVSSVSIALGQYLNRLASRLFEVNAERFEHTSGDALALTHQPQQQMLRADVVMAQAARLIDRQLDDLLGARGEADLAEHHPVATPNNMLDRRTRLIQLDAEIVEDLGGDAVALAHETEKEVFGPNVVVVEALRFFL